MATASDHPISIFPTESRVRVRLGGRVIAESSCALTLREAGYPPVQYIPREDVDMSALERSEQRSHCPWKGEAAYFSIRVGDRLAENAAWSYEAPKPAVAAIAGFLAFYPDRVDAIEIED